MIQLQRVRTTQAIPGRFHGPGRITTERALLELQRAGKGPKSSVWKQAKPQLRTETDGKCAYCEGKASHVAHGDVEHFRPKSVYWWLAYCYDNYVYACQICNQTFKGSNFPTTGPAMQGPDVQPTATDAELDALAGALGPDPMNANQVSAFHTAGSAEDAGIPEPYATDPERLFTWKVDGTLREVEIQARDASAAATRAEDAVTRFLGLNRDELKRWRYEIYDVASLLTDTLKSGRLDPPLTQRTEDRLTRMMSLTGEFAALVRFHVREEQGLPL